MKTELTRHGTLHSEEEFGLVGITDLNIHQGPSGQTLFAAGRGGGWLSAYQVNSGSAGSTLQQQWLIDPEFLQLETTEIVIRDLPGQDQLLLAGLRSDGLQGFALEDGEINRPVSVETSNNSAGSFTEFALFPDQSSAVVALRGGGLATLTFDSASEAVVAEASIPSPFGGSRAADVAVLAMDGTDYVVASYGSEDTIALYQRSGDASLQSVSNLSVSDGLWIDRPGALALTSAADGGQYVVVASSGSDSLTTLNISQAGLTPVDHLLDTINSRFADASHVTSVVVEDHHFILAAGSDSGVSLLSVLPGGRLQHIQEFAGDAGHPLRGISDLEATQTPEGIRFWVSTDGPPFLSEFSISMTDLGINRQADTGNGTLTGTQEDDVLAGSAGDIRIDGKSGDDILMDGAGQDILVGGPGSDIFIFSQDNNRDAIEDFDPEDDMIDLSAFGVAGALGTLEISSRSWGAELRWGEEVLDVRTADATTLLADDFTSVNLVTTGRIVPAEVQISGPNKAPSAPVAAMPDAPPPPPASALSPFSESAEPSDRFAFAFADPDTFDFEFDAHEAAGPVHQLDAVSVGELASEGPPTPASDATTLDSGSAASGEYAENGPIEPEEPDAAI